MLLIVLSLMFEGMVTFVRKKKSYSSEFPAKISGAQGELGLIESTETPISAIATQGVIGQL